MAEYDWGEINGLVVERLREPKTVPVPEAILKQAQRSADADLEGLAKKEGTLGTLVLQHHFADSDQAAAFAKYMRKAGDMTTPKTTMLVIVDPLKTGDGNLIRWQAGRRRGKR